MRILLVEDDEALGEGIRVALKPEGYTVDWARDGASALHALTHEDFGLAVLDLGLPRMDGLEVLKRLRAGDNAIPVLVLTARDSTADRIAGLDAGADDYLVKPFQPDELAARLRAVLRRAQGRVSPVLTARNIRLDPASRSVTRDGEPVNLSLHEYRTLLAMMERQGRVVTRQQLEEAVYGGESSIESNTVAVYVHQLRKKLGDDLIVTVHGHGYKLNSTP
jgi:two-component system OmpR family response regulator